MRKALRKRLTASLTIPLAALLLTGATCGGGGGGGSNGGDAGGSSSGDAAMDAQGDGSSGAVVERCGIQTQNPDGPSGDAGMDAGNAGADAGSAPMLPGSFTFDSEYEMRFTDFAFTDDSPGSAANGILQNYLDQKKDYPIIVLLHLKNIAAQMGTADLRGGAGLKVDKKCDPSASDCEYKWDPMSPDTYNEISVDDQTGELRGGLQKLNFIGTTEFEDGSIDKFTLPIYDLYFTNSYLGPASSGDGVVIEQGHIEGYVTEQDADNAKVSIVQGNTVPISDLLNKNKMNYDSDDDGEVDSWCLTATFSAKETKIVQN